MDTNVAGPESPTSGFSQPADFACPLVPLWYRLLCPMCPDRPRTGTMGTQGTLRDASTLNAVRLGAERSPVQIRPPRLSRSPVPKRVFGISGFLVESPRGPRGTARGTNCAGGDERLPIQVRPHRQGGTRWRNGLSSSPRRPCPLALVARRCGERRPRGAPSRLSARPPARSALSRPRPPVQRLRAPPRSAPPRPSHRGP
jgi:hypothetical protein